MTPKRKPYKTYPKEFKLEALRLIEQSDKPASEIATQLGIRRNQLYKWKEQMTQKQQNQGHKSGSSLAVTHFHLKLLHIRFRAFTGFE